MLRKIFGVFLVINILSSFSEGYERLEQDGQQLFQQIISQVYGSTSVQTQPEIMIYGLIQGADQNKLNLLTTNCAHNTEIIDALIPNFCSQLTTVVQEKKDLSVKGSGYQQTITIVQESQENQEKIYNLIKSMNHGSLKSLTSRCSDPKTSEILTTVIPNFCSQLSIVVKQEQTIEQNTLIYALFKVMSQTEVRSLRGSCSNPKTSELYNSVIPNFCSKFLLVVEQNKDLAAKELPCQGDAKCSGVYDIVIPILKTKLVTIELQENAAKEYQGNFIYVLVKSLDKTQLSSISQSCTDSSAVFDLVVPNFCSLFLIEVQAKMIKELATQTNIKVTTNNNRPLTYVTPDHYQPPPQDVVPKYTRNCDGQSSGMHYIGLPEYSNSTFKVLCEQNRWGDGWIVVLRRQDGSETFYRNWNDYKNGFGKVSGEFFIGLDNLHALTADSNMELLVVLEDHEGNEKFERYDDFGIGAEDAQYILFKLGTAQGDAGDSLSQHHGHKFTTFDRDNDRWSEGNCASDNLGAWWYHACLESQLTGIYKTDMWAKGINWRTFRERHYSHKRALMMIRPKK